MGNLYSIVIVLLKKACILLGFFLIFFTVAYSQNTKLIDSLEIIYTAGEYEDDIRLQILEELARNHPDPENALIYSEELLQLAKQLDSTDYLFRGYLNKGNALRMKGDLSKALENYFISAKIAVEDKNNGELGIVNITIADAYSIMGNHNKSIQYLFH